MKWIAYRLSGCCDFRNKNTINKLTLQAMEFIVKVAIYLVRHLPSGLEWAILPNFLLTTGSEPIAFLSLFTFYLSEALILFFSRIYPEEPLNEPPKVQPKGKRIVHPVYWRLSARLKRIFFATAACGRFSPPLHIYIFIIWLYVAWFGVSTFIYIWDIGQPDIGSSVIFSTRLLLFRVSS